MKLKINEAIKLLSGESDRYTQLAKDYALKNLLSRGNTDAADKAREHLLRAETFKAAAALIS